MTAIIFDKTGTLTEGKPKVTDMIPLGSQVRGSFHQEEGGIRDRSAPGALLSPLLQLPSGERPGTVSITAMRFDCHPERFWNALRCFPLQVPVPEIVRLTGAAETSSEHPLGRALVSYAQETV